MSDLDDTCLIEKILNGDDRVFSYLIDKYQKQVFNFVLYTLRNREDADEVVQDTFVKAYRALHTFRNEARFSTWLLRIAYFTCMSRMRKNSPVMVNVSDDGSHLSDNNVSQFTDLGDMRTILAIALDKLAEEEKTVVTLYYYNEQSIREICEISGKNPSSVKVILHRSRKKLLKILNKMGVVEWTV